MASPGLILLLQVGHCQTLLRAGARQIRGCLKIDMYLCQNCWVIPECGGQAGVAEEVAAGGGHHLCRKCKKRGRVQPSPPSSPASLSIGPGTLGTAGDPVTSCSNEVASMYYDDLFQYLLYGAVPLATCLGEGSQSGRWCQTEENQQGHQHPPFAPLLHELLGLPQH